MRINKLTHILLEKPSGSWPGIMKALRIVLRPVPGKLHSEIKKLIRWAAGEGRGP